MTGAQINQQQQLGQQALQQFQQHRGQMANAGLGVQHLSAAANSATFNGAALLQRAG